MPPILTHLFSRGDAVRAPPPCVNGISVPGRPMPAWTHDPFAVRSGLRGTPRRHHVAARADRPPAGPRVLAEDRDRATARPGGGLRRRRAPVRRGGRPRPAVPGPVRAGT